jgi:hypothetical protein
MTMELTGPFFTVDPARTYRQNIRDLMDKLAKTGENEVKARLYPGAPATAARDYIHGRTHSLKTGKRWATYAVISSTDRSLSGEDQRKANAQLSGRRVTVVGRVFKPTNPSRMGRNIGAMRGAEGRKAFAGAASALRAIAKRHDMSRGL